MNTYELMRQAIQNKTSVACWYKGHYRVLSPHILGTKNGRRKVLAVQTAGESGSGLRPTNEQNWRCMFLDDIESPQSHDDRWETASNRSRFQPCVDQIDYEVK